MATVHVRADAPVPPERIRAALTDFTDHRFAYFPHLDPSRYRVHAAGGTWAEVTEGAAFAGGIWERSGYDWSTPGVIRLQVIDSNAFRPGSSWEYRIRPDGRGGSHVDLTVRRLPRTAKGRLLTALLTVFGRRVFRTDLAKTLALLDGQEQPSGDAASRPM
jgi:hypothetical protein